MKCFNLKRVQSLGKELISLPIFPGIALLMPMVLAAKAVFFRYRVPRPIEIKSLIITQDALAHFGFWLSILFILMPISIFFSSWWENHITEKSREDIPTSKLNFLSENKKGWLIIASLFIAYVFATSFIRIQSGVWKPLPSGGAMELAQELSHLIIQGDIDSILKHMPEVRQSKTPNDLFKNLQAQVGNHRSLESLILANAYGPYVISPEGYIEYRARVKGDSGKTDILFGFYLKEHQWHLKSFSLSKIKGNNNPTPSSTTP